VAGYAELGYNDSIRNAQMQVHKQNGTELPAAGEERLKNTCAIGSQYAAGDFNLMI